MSTFCFYILNKTAHIFPVCIYGFFHSGLFDGYVQRIFADSRNRGAGTSAVIRTIVIVSQFDDNPVSGAYTFDYIRPKTVVESTAAGTSQRMILNSNPVGIEIFTSKIAPSPLSVVAIA